MIEASRDRAALLERFWYVEPVAHKAREQKKRNGRSKLSDDQVREIRSRYANGETATRMAPDYPVAVKNVWRVCVGESYQWVK